MQSVDRRWQQKMAALAFLLALLACWLITGSLITVFTHVLLILWLLASSCIVYRAIFYWHVHWYDELPMSGSPASPAVDQESATASAPTPAPTPPQDEPMPTQVESESPAPGPIIIGEVFYYSPSDRSQPKPGRLSFRAGSLQFSGETARAFNLRELPVESGEVCQVLIGDRAFDSPIRGRLIPHHQVRLVSGTGEELAVFLMTMAQAQLLDGLVREYLSERQRSWEDSCRQFLGNVGEVAGQWRSEQKVQAIAQAFLQKSNQINLLNPELLMSIERCLRDRLPDGHLGYHLFWVSADQTTTQMGTQSPDTHTEEARSFYNDSFQLYVRLLVKDCPPKDYPFIVYAHAAWLLLREAAGGYFAASLWGRIRPTGKQKATAFTLSSVLDAYVEKHDQRTAYLPENVLQLAYLLAHVGLIAAPAAFPEHALKSIYDQTKNVLLLQEAVRLQISNAWERAQLERFERDLFSPGG